MHDHHVFILEGGYFWKQLPAIVLPNQTDLFGQPLGNSKRTCSQHHGIFIHKTTEAGKYRVLLALLGRAVIYDDVLKVHETTQLRSEILLEVPKGIYDYPFEPGAAYIINSQGEVTKI